MYRLHHFGHYREHQGLIPDFMNMFLAKYGPFSFQLVELKFISTAMGGKPGRQKAVDQMANGLPKLYLVKAQINDRKSYETQQEHVGPLQQHL